MFYTIKYKILAFPHYEYHKERTKTETLKFISDKINEGFTDIQIKKAFKRKGGRIQYL